METFNGLLQYKRNARLVKNRVVYSNYAKLNTGKLYKK